MGKLVLELSACGKIVLENTQTGEKIIVQAMPLSRESTKVAITADKHFRIYRTKQKTIKG